jgi:hypothetical protein
LQRRHGVVPPQAASEGIGQAAGKQMHLTGRAARRARRYDFDPDRQRRRLEHGHKLAQRATFPFGDPISRGSGHSSDPSLSYWLVSIDTST